MNMSLPAVFFSQIYHIEFLFNCCCCCKSCTKVAASICIILLTGGKIGHADYILTGQPSALLFKVSTTGKSAGPKNPNKI